MVESGEDADLGGEACGEIGLGGEIGQQDLHCLDAAGDDVASTVDLSHATSAEEGEDFVIANRAPGSKAMRDTSFERKASLGRKRRVHWRANNIIPTKMRYVSEKLPAQVGGFGCRLDCGAGAAITVQRLP